MWNSGSTQAAGALLEPPPLCLTPPRGEDTPFVFPDTEKKLLSLPGRRMSGPTQPRSLAMFRAWTLDFSTVETGRAGNDTLNPRLNGGSPPGAELGEQTVPS